MNKINISQSTVWITGASGGIGSALAREFAPNCSKLILGASSEKSISKIKNEFDNINAEFIPIDFADPQFEKYLTSASLSETDILINNAGIALFKSLSETSLAEYDKLFSVNLRSAFAAIQTVLPGMKKRQKGIIVNILSIAAKKIFTHSAIYAASKAALGTMANVLREETRSDGIRVINIYPGAVSTNIWDKASLEKMGDDMMTAKDAAHAVFNAVELNTSASMTVEELVLRPSGGDL